MSVVLLCLHAANASNVRVRMNNTSPTMSLIDLATQAKVEVGEPDSSKDYKFEVPSGKYLLTAFATDGKTVNGTIELSVVPDSLSQEFTVLTCTTYATNKGADGAIWTAEKGDYSIDLKVCSREGVFHKVTMGKSTTANRYTFLALNGNSYYLTFIPSDAHRAEGFTDYYKNGTLTGGVSVSGAIPKGSDYVVTVPKDADFRMNLKFSHFVDFTPIAPTKEEISGNTRQLTFYLAQGQVYNYRTGIKGKLTRGGYFTMAADEAKRPVLNFTPADYDFDPALINHSPQANGGFETGDIMLNINPQGHLKLKPGESFKAHALRSWELTDNSSNNYFIEPDFNYTILDLNGKPSDNVIRIAQNNGSSWADIEAIGEGTAIVLVTYDAIGLNFYSGIEKKPFLGGEIWGAIWPENTAAYVVTVGNKESSVVPNMLINEKYNEDTKKLAGKYVDAEHDVFYYLDTEEGALYTFKPENAASVEIAYPSIGERMAVYNGFSTNGVTRNEDGSYTLLLKHGRQIVKLTDASGEASYQVLTAKACHREIVNEARPGSKIFQPGDKVNVVFSGLYHPANKIAGIYNMSAYVTYNGVPNGTSLILSSNQYNFASSKSAQTVTVDIPSDFDVTENPSMILDDGVIQVNGFGDPIGCHRSIDPFAGRSPNFTAVPHKTYFGLIPPTEIKITPLKTFDIKVVCDQTDADVELLFNGNALTKGDNDLYVGTYGNYSLKASKPGYRCSRIVFNIPDDAEGIQTFKVNLIPAENAWDGKTLTEPLIVDNAYQISSGEELAWFASKVNDKNANLNADLVADIDLGDYDWTPVGKATGTPFSGIFNGHGHSVKGLYIDLPKLQYQSLFGVVKGSDKARAAVMAVEVEGRVSCKKDAAGIVGYAWQYADISKCANKAEIIGVEGNAGGIVSYIANANVSLSDCYNTGDVTAPSNAGGIVGRHVNKPLNVRNVYSIGEVVCSKYAGACVGGSYAKTGLVNAFALHEYEMTENHQLVSIDQFRSGEVAYKLGSAFGQVIGEEEYPVFGSAEVFYDEAENRYHNDESTTSVEAGTVAPAVEELYFNAEGLSSRTPFKGLNIVRMSDGSYRKIILN